MKYYFLLLMSIVIAAGTFAGCNSVNSKNSNDLKMVSEPDSVFSNLFIRNCCGFTGGDGTYSVLLPDGRTVWIFGDTFLGTVNPDLTREKQTPVYIRNSFVVQDGDSLTTLHQVRPPLNASMIIPYAQEEGGLTSESERWFWPGDGLIEGGKLKVFLSQFSQPDTGMWGFRWESTWLATFTLPEIIQESLIEIPYSQALSVHYGHAILEEADFTYVYGALEGEPHAARYPSGDVSGVWEFYNGDEWTCDPAESRPMGNMPASEQFTVMKIREKYTYITQLDSFSTEICSFLSDTPYGPWGNKSLLYTTPIPGNDRNLITYNAIVHPQFTEKDRVLLSYNMNSFILEDHFRNADIYRPRFIWVPFKLIDPGY